MMFFREDSKAFGGYSLHSYMKLSRDKAKAFKSDQKLFDK